MPTDSNRATRRFWEDFDGFICTGCCCNCLKDAKMQASIDSCTCQGTLVQVPASQPGVLRLTTTACPGDNDLGEASGQLNYRVQDGGRLYYEVRFKLNSGGVSAGAINLGLNDDALDDSNTLPFEIDACEALTSNNASGIALVYDTNACPQHFFFAAVDDCNDHACAPLDTKIVAQSCRWYTASITLEDQGACKMAHADVFLQENENCCVPGPTFEKRILCAIDRDVFLAPYHGYEVRTACTAGQVDIDYVIVEAGRSD